MRKKRRHREHSPVAEGGLVLIPYLRAEATDDGLSGQAGGAASRTNRPGLFTFMFTFRGAIRADPCLDRINASRCRAAPRCRGHRPRSEPARAHFRNVHAEVDERDPPSTRRVESDRLTARRLHPAVRSGDRAGSRDRGCERFVRCTDRCRVALVAGSSIAEFEKAASVLRELEQASLCRVVILAPFGQPSRPVRFVQFVVVDDDQRTAQILEAASLSRETLGNGSDEVARVLSAVLKDSGATGFAQQQSRLRAQQQSRLRERASPGRTPEASEGSTGDEEKYRIAERTFDIPALKARVWLKRTAKDNLPVSIEWEVADKVQDEDVRRPSDRPVRFATVRFVGTPARYDLFQTQTREMLLTVDREDVLVMLDILERLRDAFESA